MFWAASPTTLPMLQDKMFAWIDDSLARFVRVIPTILATNAPGNQTEHARSVAMTHSLVGLPKSCIGLMPVFIYHASLQKRLVFLHRELSQEAFVSAHACVP